VWGVGWGGGVGWWGGVGCGGVGWGVVGWGGGGVGGIPPLGGGAGGGAASTRKSFFGRLIAPPSFLYNKADTSGKPEVICLILVTCEKNALENMQTHARDNFHNFLAIQH
jgi:hypothetical protein